MFQDSASNVSSDGPVRFFALPLEYVRSTSGADMQLLIACSLGPCHTVATFSSLVSTRTCPNHNVLQD